MSLTLATRTLIEPAVWSTPHGFRWRPEKIRTYGPEVADVCAAAGYAPDPQQELMLDLTFAVQADARTPECFEVAAEATRRNLKTGWLIQCIIGWVHVLQIPEIMYSAHEMATAHKTQQELARIMRDSPLLRKHMLPQKNDGIYEGKVDERIELRHGRTVWFKTRTNDGGRGLGKPKLIMDEWFAGKSAQTGSLGPIMANYIDAQILYASSAPKADSHELHDLIGRGEEGGSPTLAFCAWRAPREPCADPHCRHPKNALRRGIDCALDREHLIIAGNPTISTGRISVQTLRNLRQVMQPAEYSRECMGWGDEEAKAKDDPAMDDEAFEALLVAGAKPPKRAAIMLDVSPDRKWASIGVAGQGSKRGKILVITYTKPGTAWVVPKLQKILAKRNVVQVALHPRSQATLLQKPLQEADIDYDPLTSVDMGEATSNWISYVESGQTLEHTGQSELVGANGNARTRFNGEAVLWDRRDPAGANITPLVAGSGAALLWGRYAVDDYDDIEDSFL